MPYICAVSPAFPRHCFSQKDLIDAIKERWDGHIDDYEPVVEMQHHVAVKSRHLALPLRDYWDLGGLERRTASFQKVALELAEAAVNQVLAAADLSPEAIDILVSNTTTGLAVPTLEAKLMNRIAFKTSTKRLPLFGLGCLAGTAGLNRLAEYLVGHPQSAAVFFTVEICSLNMHFGDTSLSNIISSGLFGDGAAAVLMVGDEHPLAARSALKWVGGHSVFFPNSERIMGWDFIDNGMSIVMSKEVPDYALRALAELSVCLEKLALSRSELEWFAFHPGGPKILALLTKALQLPDGALRASWEVLGQYGNISSASVLVVLHQLMTHKALNPGTKGLMMSLGPAFCAEFGIWQAC